MNRRLTLAAGVATVAIAVTACNSSSTPSSPNAPSASSVTPVTGDDKQRAAAIQLTVADLPGDWKSQKITTKPAEQQEEDAFFDGCLGTPTIDDVQTASSQVQFNRADGFLFAHGLINVTTTEALAQKYEAALSGSQAVSCAAADAKKFFKAPKDATIVSIVGSPLTPPEPVFGYRVVITLHLTAKDRDVPLTFDTYGVIVKRFITRVTFEGVIQAPQRSLADSVTAKVFARAIANAA